MPPGSRAGVAALTWRFMLRFLAPALALVLVVPACGDDDAATTTAVTTTSPGTVVTTAPPTTAASTTTAPTPTTTTDPFETTTTTAAGLTVIEVTYTDGGVKGADGRVAVDTGEQVRIEVTSDVADEVHLHGYDLTADVAAGTPAVIEFIADIPGIFEVELEDAGTLLFELQVS